MEVHFVEGDRRFDFDGGQSFGEQGLISKFFDAFAVFAFDVVGIGDDVFDRTVFFEQVDGCFGSYARHPGDIVDTISNEAQGVDYLLNLFDFPLLQNFFSAENFDAIALS